MEQRLILSSGPKTLVHSHNQPMKNLQSFVLKLAQAHPNAPLDPPAETLLRDCLDRFISDYRTPDHPPYSHMIEDALKELNEKAGSTKKSISQYLEKKYDNLPWAHTVLLKHHLEKACKDRRIRVTRTKKYRLAGSLNSGAKVKRRPQKSKWKWECERQKHHQLKIRLVKTRNDPRGGAVEKCDEQEQPLTENGEDQTKSLLSCADGKKSFHSNPSCVDGEKSFHSNPSILHDEPLGMISFQKNGPSSVSEAVHQGKEHLEHEQPEPSTPERPPGFESVRVENLHQPDVVDVMNANEKSKLTEQEPKEQLLSQKTKIFQGKQLRRSLRTRPSAKPGVAKDAAALPPEGCPAVRPVRVCRRLGASLKRRPRSRPPPKPMKTTCVDEPQDSPKSQKPVKNLKAVDECREEEVEQSGKHAECSRMLEVLPPDKSKEAEEEGVGRPPKRRSARLLK